MAWLSSRIGGRQLQQQNANTDAKKQGNDKESGKQQKEGEGKGERALESGDEYRVRVVKNPVLTLATGEGECRMPELTMNGLKRP